MTFPSAFLSFPFMNVHQHLWLNGCGHIILSEEKEEGNAWLYSDVTFLSQGQYLVPTRMSQIISLR
jgi:hypothetical protein